MAGQQSKVVNECICGRCHHHIAQAKDDNQVHICPRCGWPASALPPREIVQSAVSASQIYDEMKEWSKTYEARKLSQLVGGHPPILDPYDNYSESMERARQSELDAERASQIAGNLGCDDDLSPAELAREITRLMDEVHGQPDTPEILALREELAVRGEQYSEYLRQERARVTREEQNRLELRERQQQEEYAALEASRAVGRAMEQARRAVDEATRQLAANNGVVQGDSELVREMEDLEEQNRLLALELLRPALRTKTMAACVETSVSEPLRKVTIT